MQARPHLKILLIVVALAVIIVGATTAFARVDNVIVVNSTDDTYIIGDGKCTLREAINNANADSLNPPNSIDCAMGFNADTIELGNNLDYVLSVVDSGFVTDPNGLPVITSNITINGHGSSIYRDFNPATPQFRIFKINFSGILTLNDVSMSNGWSPNNGGGLWNEGSLIMNNSSITDSLGNQGGGIYNKSYLELNHSAVNFNDTAAGSSSGPTPGYDGGGIYSAATGKIEIANSEIIGNRTGIGGTSGITTAAAGNGGGVYNLGTFKITHSTVSGNDSGDGANPRGNGGGFYLNGSGATIINTTIASNLAKGGAGIYQSGGAANIYRSTINDNGATTGGGLYATSAVNVYNTTLSKNAATMGGATYTTGTTNSVYNTIAGNTTTTGGNVNVAGGTFSTNNTIFGISSGANCSGALVNQLKNIDSGTSCGFGSANGSMSSTDPKIFALVDNGGPNKTMAIASDSPARDQGDTGICTDGGGGVFNQDARIFLRIKVPSDICDIGAYEFGAAAGAVNPTATRTATITPTNVPTGVTRTPTPLPVPPTATNTPDPCPNAPFAPTLTSPAGNAEITNTRPTLKWAASSCATSYNVTVRRKNNVVDSATGLTELKYKTIALEAGRRYTWTVEACNNHGCNTSEVRHFRILP